MPTNSEWFDRKKVPWVTFTRKAWWVTSISVIAICGIGSSISYNIGRNDGRDEVSATVSMPECQEDEYLYPDNYEGPGKNLPSEYHCTHIDEAVATVVKVTLDYLGLYDPETGSALIPPANVTKE